MFFLSFALNKTVSDTMNACIEICTCFDFIVISPRTYDLFV
jgi:hypothetical protein